ncbi:SEC-C metal-binding domain-containing protein [Sphingobacterium alimentarium]|uniref:SEC-C metal-binding domain-containing protein n=1 Tax=Sphingobacterium alimentarium TaxID=797292 RepID=UPI0037436439
MRKIALIAGMMASVGMSLSSANTKNLGRVRRYVNPKEEVKHPRNSPCLCGSGKKYKKCCLNKSDHA